MSQLLANSKKDSIDCGRSSGVERHLAKVKVEGSNPFARSNFPKDIKMSARLVSAGLFAVWAVEPVGVLAADVDFGP